ncbi:MAG: DNA polymerase III subunit alpha [Alphaproteobacteria bacterium]|nr:DNA polymerase III subunit alpha [Alphaproteobacteria bacterium]
MPADFVHLRVHSEYSLLEGAVRISDMTKFCKALRMPAVAITDNGNLFGTVEFSQKCSEAGVQPIIGCKLYVKNEKASSIKTASYKTHFDEIVLLVQNSKGYANLLKLVSRSFIKVDEDDKSGVPHVLVDDIEKYNEGLILLTGGIAGLFGYHLIAGNIKAAEETLIRFNKAFKDRIYIELMRHGLEEEQKIEAHLIDIAYKYDIPLVATNDAFFTTKGMYEAHDALICIKDGSYVVQDDRRRLTPEHYFKTPEEMRELFADLPEAVDNTVVIAKRCAYMFEPVAPCLPAFPVKEGRTEAEELRENAATGLEKRLEVHVYQEGMNGHDKELAAKPYYQRLEYELKILEDMGFPGYFLIVADFIKWSNNNNVPVGPGRGSGAGSVVAWALTITDLDPLKFGLLFERFLNPERVSMPDFDIDFCQEKRGKVIEYVQNEYGFDRVAQIVTFGKLKARAVLRDVGRVLQIPYGQVDRICKLIPNEPGSEMTLKEAIESETQLREMRDNEAIVAKLLDVGMKLEGLNRHASTHAAGVVIGGKPLDEIVPLYKDSNSDMPVTQFNMKYVESTGLVKFDFLGLKTLTVLAKAVELVKKDKGIDIDLSALPHDDKKTFELLSRAETFGVFQLESVGMRDVLRKLKPDSIEEIIAIVALYRPGPMDNIPSYINRKFGKEKLDYMHPTLEPILKETFGVIIYQEQVMQIAQVLSGYSLGGADILRRAMGKKKKEEMDKQRKVFIDGATARQIPEAKSSMIFDQVAKFAGYGFNKSHAAAYAFIAYQTAYLKANYPVEFMAASMTLDIHNTDKLAAFKEELVNIGVELLPPDINSSDITFTVENDAVRYALPAIKSVGEGAVKISINERKKNGSYKDISDFTQRLDASAINKRQLENLVKSGAFDCIESNRAKVFNGISKIIGHASAATNDRNSSQVSLFGEMELPKISLPECPDWPMIERLEREAEAIGFFLSAHPLDNYESKTLERLRVVKSSSLLHRRGTSSLKMVGILNSKRERISKSGNRYAFADFSDAYGSFSVTFFSEILGKTRDMLESGQPLLLTLNAERVSDDEQPRLTASNVQMLDEAVSRAAKGLIITFDRTDVIEPLNDIIKADGRGKGKIHLVVRLEDRDVEIVLEGKFAISAHTIGALRKQAGILEVREL